MGFSEDFGSVRWAHYRTTNPASKGLTECATDLLQSAPLTNDHVNQRSNNKYTETTCTQVVMVARSTGETAATGPRRALSVKITVINGRQLHTTLLLATNTSGQQ
ncbi:hypothetical protein CBL_01623 [Carabus blaptoides fortunei]